MRYLPSVDTPSAPPNGYLLLFNDAASGFLTVQHTDLSTVNLEGWASVLTTKGDLWGFSTVNARIPVGSNGQVLTADSTAALGVSWQAGGSGTPAVSVTSETTYGIAPAVGVSTNYARQDHTHGSPTAPTAASVGADAVGTSAAGIAAHVAAGDPHTQYMLESALTTNEDILIRRGGVPTRLPVGAEGTVPVVVGGVVVWTALSVSLSVFAFDAQAFDLSSMDVISTVTQA
jgi:hypothetical protein